MEEDKSQMIYRFNVKNKELYANMIDFAEDNYMMERVELKEEFENWINKPKISEMLEEERAILCRTDYDLKKNELKMKIFKSIKYYHIKNIKKSKGLSEGNDTVEKNEKKSERVTFSSEFLCAVKNNVNLNEKPSNCYELFIKNNEDLIRLERQRLVLLGLSDTIIEYKMKKMFKNQYFMTKNK